MCFSMKYINISLMLLCSLGILFVAVHSEEINVDLSSYRPDKNGHKLFSNTYILSQSTVVLNIDKINDDVGFLLVQVHSFLENITLSETSVLKLHSYVTGTNIGMLWADDDSNDATFYLLRNIKVSSTVKILLVINVYDEQDPVPGGCNLTFDTINAPYQKVTYTDDVISVNAQPPSAYGISCDKSQIEVDTFHLYLPEYDNQQDTYFNGLTKMLTVEDIKTNGKRVYSLDGRYKYGRLFSSYRGTGEIFGLIATYKNRSSAYVPAVSYGCDLLSWETSCIGPVTEHWKFLCAILLIFGIFVCFFGHKFFRATLFLIGFAFGMFITYLMVSADGDTTPKEGAIISIAFGVVYGLVWMVIWWIFGIPLFSVLLTFVLAGTLVASTIFYAGLGNFFIFTNDINFWVCFFCVIIICMVIWTPATMHGHIFACSLLGSYATVVATNYYLGGNLQYIFLNTYRRIVVKHFKYAVIDPPFQNVDLLQSLLWIILFIFGSYIQLRDQRNKPPFPPNRCRVASDTPSETTPLLQATAPPEYV